MEKRFIRCTDCQSEVIMRSKFDNWPEYFIDPRTKETQVILRDDFKKFLDRHKKHRLEELRVIGGPWSDEPYYEPVKIVFYRATNEKEDFTIKGSREKIEEPIVYQIIPGEISERVSKIEIDLNATRKQIMAERPDFNRKVLNHFINQLKILARTTTDIQGEEDKGHSSMYPSESFYLIDGISLVWLERQLRAEEFKAEKFEEEKDFLSGFINRESIQGGILHFKVTRSFKVKQ